MRRALICFFTGHRPSGEFARLSAGGRVVQRCAYCDGWLGSMFWWRKAKP